jgi:hypothetical protein
VKTIKGAETYEQNLKIIRVMEAEERDQKRRIEKEKARQDKILATVKTAHQKMALQKKLEKARSAKGAVRKEIYWKRRRSAKWAVRF